MRKTFKFSQETLLRYATDQTSFLEEDLKDFLAFDPNLNVEKRERMIELINWALSEGGDEINMSVISNTTEKVNEELKNAKNLYHQGKYWVLKAFPESKAIQRQFGIGRFSKIAKNQESMVSFMKSFAQSMRDYQTQLEAACTPPGFVDFITAQAESLEAANNEQEKKKGSRIIDTEERIRKLNELHQHTKDFNAAAEFVYHDSPAKRDLYRPPSQRNAAEDEVRPG